MSNRRYPALRVFTLMLLTPALSCIFFFLIMLLASLGGFNIKSESLYIKDLGVTLLLFTYGAMVIYFPPAFAVSFSLFLIKPAGYFRNILLVSLFCGFIFAAYAHLTGVANMVFGNMSRAISITNHIAIENLIVFTLATTSGFILAMLALPRKDSYVEDNYLNDAGDSEFHDEVLQFSASNLPEKQYFL